MEYETYFITNKKNKALTREDFVNIVKSIVRDETSVKNAQTNNNVTITFTKEGTVLYRSQLEYNESANGKITVKLDKNDPSLLYTIRHSCLYNDFRIFSLNLGVFLPISLDINEIDSSRIPKDRKELLDRFSLQPVYSYKENVYVIDKEKKVRILNTDLFEYFFQWAKDDPVQQSELTELSYVVAESLTEFTTYFNANLIPDVFYEYYNKSQKIINKSAMNINNPSRKIFVKPLVYEFESEWNEFYMRTTEQGNQILMDKILPGETLDSTLKRVLTLLNLKEDYMRALVLPHPEFDRDKQNIITPRLIVHVYINKMTKIPDILKRGWVPITN